MKQILWPESGKSFSQQSGVCIHRIWAYGIWGKTVVIALALTLVISGIGWFLFGWVFLKLTVLELIKEFKSFSWSNTKGTVQSSRVEYMEGMYGPSGKEGGDWYQTWLDYRYSVKGTWYTSNETIGGSFSERGTKRLISKYPPHASIMVYYDPENPQVSSIKEVSGLGEFFLCRCIVSYASELERV